MPGGRAEIYINVADTLAPRVKGFPVEPALADLVTDQCIWQTSPCTIVFGFEKAPNWRIQHPPGKRACHRPSH